MTRTVNARVAGLTYLLYIAVAFPGMMLFDRATRAEGIAAKLAHIAEHTTDLRITVVLSLLSCFAALVLGVTLYGITRDEDRELAVLGLCCRVGEGVLSAMFVTVTLGLLWLGTSAAGGSAPDAAAAQALGSLLLKVRGWGPLLGATLFAVGSMLFCYLLLRGRMVPVVLAGLGVLASVLLVVGLPLQITGVLSGPAAQLMWIPMALFELTLGPWLLIKGVAPLDARRPYRAE